MKTLSFDDSNAYRWVATKPDAGGMWKIIVEKDAPYKRRELQAPGAMTDAQLKAFVEASVAIPERVVATTKKTATKHPANPPPNIQPVPGPAPTPPDNGGGNTGMLLLLALGAFLLLGKKRR